MTPTILVQPIIEPVSLAEAKLWTRAVDEDDTLLRGLISAAREYCEDRKGYAFYEQTLQISMDAWPSRTNRLILPRATPLRSVVSVGYTDSDGVNGTIPSGDYTLDTFNYPGSIAWPSGYSWPEADNYAAAPVRITYVAGMPITSPLTYFPESIKVAMRLLIAHWYRNKEAVIVGQSAGVSSAKMEIGVDALLAVNQQIYAF